MKMKAVAGLAFLFNTLLFGTYYSVAKDALERIDPIVFTFFVMMVLVPVGLCILALSWHHLTKEVIKSGALLGSCLCLGLFTLAVALKYNSATSTAFFPALNGLLAVIFTWLFLRQPISKLTWLAGAVSVIGTVLLITNSPMGGARGALIAFIGGLFCTFYVFLADHEQKDQSAYWALFGVELLAMGLWASLIALLFGDWQAVHPAMPKDILTILYISLGTTFLPTLITVLLQKYISPITVSFIYILEPVLGAVAAYVYLHEMLPLYGYIGGAMVVAGSVVNTWGTTRSPSNQLTLQQQLVITSQRAQSPVIKSLMYPILCFGVGIFAVYKMGGMPPTSWRDLYHLWPQLSVSWHMHMTSILLLAAQALSWLVAWLALTIIGCVVIGRALAKVFFKPKVVALDAVDMRFLRQMGVTPYTHSSTKRRGDSQLVQRRLRERRERLAQVELVEYMEEW